MNAPQFERVHVLTIVTALVETIKRLFVTLIVLLFLLFRGGDATGDLGEIVAVAIGGVFLLISAVFTYYTFGYAVSGGNLFIKTGLISKNMRTIPMDRIQNVNITRPLVHRILGLVVLEVETAGGTEAEAKIGALREWDAELLKTRLLGTAGNAHRPAQVRNEVLYRASVKELLIAGATENQFWVILAAGASFLPFVFPVFEKEIDRLIDGGRAAMNSPQVMVLGLQILGAILAVFAVGWLVSIVTTFVKFWGFELTREAGKLRRAHGLLSHFETFVRPERVQIIRVWQNVVQRWMGYSKIAVETAGSFTQDGMAGNALLTPLVMDVNRDVVLKAAYADTELMSREWTPAGPRAMWVGIFWMFVMAGAVYAGVRFGLRQELYALPAAGGYMGLALLSRFLRAKALGYSLHDFVVASRSGVWKRSYEFLPVVKIQSVAVTQGIGQRRLGLADVVLGAAGVSVAGRSVVLRNLPADDAFEMAERLHTMSMLEITEATDGV